MASPDRARGGGAAALAAALAGAGLAVARHRDRTSPLRAGPSEVPDAGDVLPRFPPGFRFGAATAAHQVEGGLSANNWTRWERATRPDGRPTIATGELVGRAVEHWERFEADLELMVALGLDTYRFSVEWSRIEPTPGRFDDAALERYRSWCVQLRAAGIEPMVTLHHFTEPAWLTDRGGLEDPGWPEAFARFVAFVVPALSEHVDRWITVNEPNIVTVLGWLTGDFPPGARDLARTATALQTLLQGHARAAELVRRLDRTPAATGERPGQVAIAHNVLLFEPRSRTNPAEVVAARVLHRQFNASILTACRTGTLRFGFPGAGVHARIPGLAGSLDWLGVNHYLRHQVRVPGVEGPVDHGPDGTTITNDMGWDLIPDTLAVAVRWAARSGLPITVTEHGTCDAEVPDRRRQWLLTASLAALADEVARGTDVRGYVHWSLLDNVEWAHGRMPRFGLYRVDHDTLERTLTGGGERYRDIIRANR